MRIGKLLTLLLIITFLCQNVAFGITENDSTLRAPSHFGRSTEEFITERHEGDQVVRPIEEYSDRELVLDHPDTPDALKMLTERQREVLKLIFNQGWTVGEVARYWGLKQSATVSEHRKTALANLRDLLRPNSEYQTVVRNKDQLEMLTAPRGDILRMLFVEDEPKKITEIAEVMGIDRSTALDHKAAGLAELLDPDADYKVVLNNKDALKMLTRQERRVLTMLFIEKKKQREIAEIMGIDPSTVSIHKKKGLARLRELLKPGSDYQIVINNQGLLQRLTELQRRVLTMLFIEDEPKTIEETAEIIGVRRFSTVRSHRNKGIAALRELSDPDSDYQIVVNNQDLLERLSPKERSVLRMFFIEGKTRREIADALLIKLTTVSYRRIEGLKKLRHMLSPLEPVGLSTRLSSQERTGL